MSAPVAAGAPVRDAVRAVTGALKAAGIDAAGLDARLIVMHAAGLSHEDLLREPGRVLTDAQAATIDAHLRRRAAREPLARIFGRWQFHGLEFTLSPDTLVPRPETEMAVTRGAALMAGVDAPRIADAGTGSGCILLALLDAVADATGVGIDLSEGAVATARANAAALGLEGRAAFAVGNWLEDVEGPFDLVVSNPPYVMRGDIAGLEPEVRLHDPRAALDGGEDGFDAYRVLVPQAARVLKSGGWLVLETGSSQHKMVMTLLQDAGLMRIESMSDLAGHERILAAQRC